jgi:hypothetical protein
MKGAGRMWLWIARLFACLTAAAAGADLVASLTGQRLRLTGVYRYWDLLAGAHPAVPLPPAHLADLLAVPLSLLLLVIMLVCYWAAGRRSAKWGRKRQPVRGR